MSAPTNAEKHQQFLKRQKLKGTAWQCIMWGFILLSQVPLLRNFQGQWHWVWRVAGFVLIALGVWKAIPLWQAERRENAARQKQEQAELEAANLFLFGTPKMPR